MTSGAAPKVSLLTALAMAIGSSVLVWSRSPQRGFTYLGVMFLIAIIGIGLAKAGTVWQTEVQREKERELLFVGEQFRQAIGSYYENTPAGVKQYPLTLEDLLHDPRFPETRRHLRRIYTDPVTGSTEWGLVKEQERIVGVYSKSETHPLMKTLTGEGMQGFSNAATYAGWIFAYKSNGNPGALPSVSDIPAGVTVISPAENIGQLVNIPTLASHPPSIFDDQCATQFTIDSATCPGVCVQGSFDICTSCYASARERELACKQHGNVPPLVTK